MTSDTTAKVPTSVWITATFCLFVIAIIASYSHYQYDRMAREKTEKLSAESSSQFSFETERLKTIGDSGLVVVGTSLAKCAFPFDTEFNKLVEKTGASVKFVRFSRSGQLGKEFPIRQNYQALIPELLRYHPRWVFLQAETFFLGFVAKPEASQKRISIREWIEILHTNLHFLVRKVISALPPIFPGSGSLNNDVLPKPRVEEIQDDGDLFHDVVGQQEMIRDPPWDAIIHSPVFPDYISDFIKQAKEVGIEVVLLEMNRSKAGNEHFGESFRAQMTKTLHEVSLRYQIPYWQFRGDLSLDYFTDWAHLNRKGRVVFTDWFLENFSKEYGDDRL